MMMVLLLLIAGSQKKQYIYTLDLKVFSNVIRKQNLSRDLF